MRGHRTVRAVASADASLGSLRSCASRPWFLCLNAPTSGLRAGGARCRETQRNFSWSRILKVGAAEAVYVCPQ